jgi:hypothetical protein
MEPENKKVMSDWSFECMLQTNGLKIHEIERCLKEFVNYELDFIYIIDDAVVLSPLPEEEDVLNFLLYLLELKCENYKVFVKYHEFHYARYEIPKREYFTVIDNITNENGKVVNRFTHVKFKENEIIKNVITYYGNGYGNPPVFEQGI